MCKIESSVYAGAWALPALFGKVLHAPVLSVHAWLQTPRMARLDSDEHVCAGKTRAWIQPVRVWLRPRSVLVEMKEVTP